MTKNGRSNIRTFAILIAVFIVVIVLGHFIFKNHQSYTQSPTDSYSPPSQVATSTSDFLTSQTQASSTITQDKTLDSTASCTDALKAEVTAKKESFAKGQILVAFKKDQTYTQSKSTLAVYGLVVQNENDSQSSFASRHLITAAVPPSQEIIKVCQLKSDTHVSNASLDLYFNIHQ